MNHSLLNINTIFTNLLRVVLAVLVLATIFLITQNIVSAQSTGENPCTGGTTIDVDISGAVFCKDSFGNICEPSSLVEGNSAGTLRCETIVTPDGGFVPPPEVSTGKKCGDVDVAIDVGCEGDEPIMAYANAIVNFLSAGVGMAVIIMIAVGGVQYITSGGNPQATQAALKRIINAVIGLLFFIFLWAFLQWLIPGGPF